MSTYRAPADATMQIAEQALMQPVSEHGNQIVRVRSDAFEQAPPFQPS